MHYEIKYDKGPEADRKALIDIIQYVGAERYKSLVAFANHPKQTFKAIRFVWSFAGVQGRPVRAFIKRYHPRCNGGKKIKCRRIK